MTRKAATWFAALSFAALVGCGEEATNGGDEHASTGGASSGGAAGAGGSSNGGGAGAAVTGGNAGVLQAGSGGATAGSATSGSGGAGGASGGSLGGLGGALVNPTITRLIPSTLTTADGDFELVLEGSDFRMDHMVAFDHNVWTPVFVSSGELRVMIPGIALGSTPRTVEVRASRVGDPALYSNIMPFEITAPP